VELFRIVVGRPPNADSPAVMARRAEDMGWDGGRISDSQNVLPDCYYSLGMAVAGTSRLQLATAVTNTATRHPAVIASAAAAAHHFSGGRVSIGIGRGDSAVFKIGQKPDSLPVFERRIAELQAYLRGDSLIPDSDGVLSPIQWIRDAAVPKVPIDLAASGPKVIDIGARLAERLSFSVGADPARLRWAIDTARAARRAAGLDPSTQPLGAYVLIGVDEDLDKARALVRPVASIHARFGSVNMQADRPLDTVPGADRSAVLATTGAYRAAGHGLSTGEHVAGVEDEFLDRFTIVGSPAACAERVLELTEMGISRFYVLPPGADLGKSVWDAYYDRIITEVAPLVRAREQPAS
jgi:5,10-methylenetetrahydromethanopterin reductase